MNTALISILLLFPLCELTGAHQNLVVTPLGAIRGKIVKYGKNYARAFLGIRYAEPPEGQLRFKRPFPVRPWNKVLDATRFGPACVQYSTSPFPWKDDMPNQQLDCLYLNIWTPIGASRANKKTVMFWLPTGGFRISSARIDTYDGRALSNEGDVVVVTVQYRLGAEGFLYSKTEDAPGNMAMYDVITALYWVRNNIDAFGGDPNSITVFGQSAGAIIVGMLTVSPLTRGIFNRAILESGAPTILDSENINQNFETSQKIAAFVGCEDDDNTLENNPKFVVDCLKTKDALTLAKALASAGGENPRAFYPQYGTELLPRNPRIAVAQGTFSPVQVMVGSNDGDGSTILTKKNTDIFGFFGEKDPNINLTLAESLLRKEFADFNDTDAVLKEYFQGLEENDYTTIRYQLLTAVGDYRRICPSIYYAEKFAEKAPSFYYFFTHITLSRPFAPWMLAVHHAEVNYVFGEPQRYPLNYTFQEQYLGKNMIEAWTNFAKMGNPMYFSWSPYSKANPEYQIFDTGTTDTAFGPHKRHCDFFRPYFGF